MLYNTLDTPTHAGMRSPSTPRMPFLPISVSSCSLHLVVLVVVLKQQQQQHHLAVPKQDPQLPSPRRHALSITANTSSPCPHLVLTLLPISVSLLRAARQSGGHWRQEEGRAKAAARLVGRPPSRGGRPGKPQAGAGSAHEAAPERGLPWRRRGGVPVAAARRHERRGERKERCSLSGARSSAARGGASAASGSGSGERRARRAGRRAGERRAGRVSRRRRRGVGGGKRGPRARVRRVTAPRRGRKGQAAGSAVAAAARRGARALALRGRAGPRRRGRRVVGPF